MSSIRTSAYLGGHEKLHAALVEEGLEKTKTHLQRL